MKVWLDDERHEPATWVRARTAVEAITLLLSGAVEEISLDHDLGDDSAGTGYDVLTWIESAVVERRIIPPSIHVHTANPPARIRMLAAVEAIEKQVAASVADPDTQEARLAALPPGYVDTVVAKCREALGDALQEVILYGSRAYGCPGPESDVDLALIVTNRAWRDGKDEYKLKMAIDSAFDFLIDTQIYVETREEIESYRSVSISMQARILERGIRLYVSDRAPAPGKVEPKTRLSIAEKWLKLAERRIRTIEQEVNFYANEKRQLWPSTIDTEYLFMSACWSFKAVLFIHGINCADRKLRWNLVQLQRLAGLQDLELQSLSVEIHALPWHYDQFRYGNLDGVPDERTEQEFEAALAAARQIYAKCAVIIGKASGQAGGKGRQ